MNHTSNSNIKYLVASGFSKLAEALIVNWEGDIVSFIERKAGFGKHAIIVLPEKTP